MEEFIIRTYTKKELALMYFPGELSTYSRQPSDGLDPSLHPPLWNELLDMGYRKTQQISRPSR